MAEQRTLRQLAAPDANYNGLCIEYPEADPPFVLEYGLTHLLPRFNGFAGEDPHKHLNEFEVVCSAPSEHSLEDIVKQMTENNRQNHKQIEFTLRISQTKFGPFALLRSPRKDAQGYTKKP